MAGLRDDLERERISWQPHHLWQLASRYDALCTDLAEQLRFALAALEACQGRYNKAADASSGAERREDTPQGSATKGQGEKV